MADYTVLRAAEAPDFTGDSPGAFFGYARPMGAEQVAVNLRVLTPGMSHVPPGTDPSAGHRHLNIEEIYFVVSGEISIKLGDDVTTLGERDAVLIPPGTTRAVRNDSGDEAAFLMISVKVEDQQAESKFSQGFWPEAR